MKNIKNFLNFIKESNELSVELERITDEEYKSTYSDEIIIPVDIIEGIDDPKYDLIMNDPINETNNGEDLGYEEISDEEYWEGTDTRTEIKSYIDIDDIRKLIEEILDREVTFYESDGDVFNFSLDDIGIRIYCADDDYLIFGMWEYIDKDENADNCRYYKIDVGFDIDNIAKVLHHLKKFYII